MGARRLVSYPLSLAVVVAALIAATGGWIAWWNYRAGLENIRTLASGLFDQVARQTATSTEAFVRRAPPAAEGLAGIVALDRPQTSSDVMARRCIAVLRANEDFAWVSYSDKLGTFTGAFRAEDKIRVNRSHIEGGKTLFVEHELTDDGALVPVRQGDDTNYDPRTRPFYKLVAQSKQAAWTPPYVFAENVPGITYAVPFFADGGLEGVFTIDFDLGRLSELARTLQFSPNGRVVIVSDEQIVLAHPTVSIVAKIDDKVELVPAKDIVDPAMQAVLAAGDASQVDVDGTPHLARSLPIALPGGAKWRVLAFAPESDFTAGIGRRAMSSLLISLVAIVIAVIVAWILARRISKPLTYLAAEMDKVGEFRIDAGEQDHSMFREIEMMNAALAKMKGGLRSFASYVPRDLVRAVLASGQDARLSGEVRELTVYFSDLAGFTTLAETRKPDELVQFLGEYFDDMSKIIAEEHGTLDKYLGDGIMAFWGAPAKVPEHAARACVAALRSQQRLKELTPEGIALSARIGIATGDVLVGNIGSSERLNYTVMGDTANLSARLESLNKQYGTSCMIDETTYVQARSVIVARPLDVVAVKGKQRGVRVFEILALVSDNDLQAVAIAKHSTAALDAYLARRFETAADEWGKVLEHLPGDRTAVTLRDRATAFAALPPGPDWEGVTVVTEK